MIQKVFSIVIFIGILFTCVCLPQFKNSYGQSVTVCNDADSVMDHRHDCDDDDYSTSSPCQSGEMRWPSGQCVPQNCDPISRNVDGICSIDNFCGSDGSTIETPTVSSMLVSSNNIYYIIAFEPKYYFVQNNPTLSSLELSILDKLTKLSEAAKSEGKNAFGTAIDGFRDELEKRFTVGPSSMDLEIISKAMELWVKDPGNQWGEGIYDSKDLKMRSPDYATVPASQYKCNAYVAEIIYDATGKVFKVHASDKEKGKYFPYQAKEWGDMKQAIPNFPVTSNPSPGDIWSNGKHTGIFLGEFDGTPIYISARDDGFGVVGTDGIQYSHGVQIKELPSGGVFRTYQP